VQLPVFSGIGVFRNTDKEPAEKVVVKRMLEIQDEEDTKRFIKEVRIMNKLKHPNIVQFRRVCFAPCALTGRPLCVFVFMKRIYEGYEQSSENPYKIK